MPYDKPAHGSLPSRFVRHAPFRGSRQNPDPDAGSLGREDRPVIDFESACNSFFDPVSGIEQASICVKFTSRCGSCSSRRLTIRTNPKANPPDNCSGEMTENRRYRTSQHNPAQRR